MGKKAVASLSRRWWGGEGADGSKAGGVRGRLPGEAAERLAAGEDFGFSVACLLGAVGD